VLNDVIKETGAAGVLWSRCYEPDAIRRDKAIRDALSARGLIVDSRNSAVLFEPLAVNNKAGTPYMVYTPFWKACLALGESHIGAIQPKVTHELKYVNNVRSEKLDDWKLLPTKPNWAAAFGQRFAPGEKGAHALLQSFLDGPINGYKEARNVPGSRTTSRLSPHLHWGEISPRQIWYATRAALRAGKIKQQKDADHYLSELGWREFSYYLLFHFPTLPTEPLNPKFAAFPWSTDYSMLKRWQKGQTGYPIVDAAMRELWQTGWMHNRTRMVAASFLVKDLLLPWQMGEEWFWDTLIDADAANNAASWQWVSGCGHDAAPYIRIFNPVLQGEKFDPDGTYIRQFVPELAAMPNQWIHHPWDAPSSVLRAAGVELGGNYPHRLVKHDVAQKRAVATYESMRPQSQPAAQRKLPFKAHSAAK